MNADEMHKLVVADLCDSMRELGAPALAVAIQAASTPRAWTDCATTMTYLAMSRFDRDHRMAVNRACLDMAAGRVEHAAEWLSELRGGNIEDWVVEVREMMALAARDAEGSGR